MPSGTNSEMQQQTLRVGSVQVVGTGTDALFAIPFNGTVAAAGSTVSDATQIYSGLTVVTGANGTVGVKLPPTPQPGTMVVVKGTTAGVLKVWPDAAATINAIGSNGAISFASGAIPAIFLATSATQWYTIPLVPS